MAVTLTVATLMANMSIDDIDDATELVTERLAYVTEAVTHSVPVAPDVVHNEAAIRLAGYLYDSPRAPSGTRYANAMRNSGAASILFPYRIHSAGLANAVADAQNAVGSDSNPVVDVTIIAGDLVVTFADGTSETYELPAGGSAGVLNVTDGRLPFNPVEMRIGWLQTPTTPVNAATFAPPATVGTTAQTLIPDFPQDFLDLNLRRANLAIWAATDLELVAVTGNYITTAAGTALDVDGVSGSFWITTSLIGLYDGGNPVTPNPPKG